MAIRFFSDGVSFELRNKRKTAQWLQTVIAREGKRTGTLSYVFVSDAQILQLNRQFLNHNYYTDIITFDEVESDTISGEMYISIDTVRTNAAIYQTAFDNELFRVMAHGALHLCGYNDKTEAEQALMREMEDKSLQLLVGILLSS
ncbi:endoribonuclease YbeY [Bacteroidia bacterium]|nr:endoribonuclease YbeY [Bacteroidia bacterium]GHT77949.1 endoribonuclease YbeY [Bacteroidia bacterium]